jgi:hypothetical protein
MQMSIGFDIVCDTALDRGGLMERSGVDARSTESGSEVTFRTSCALGAVKDRVVGSRNEEGREFGALRRLMVDTEPLERWPPKRLENWRLTRDAKLSAR